MPIAFPETERFLLPRTAETLLSNLHRFSNLERLTTRFDYSYESLDEPQSTFSKPEAVVAWLALMSKTYSTLAKKNNSPDFKLLEIRQFI